MSFAPSDAPHVAVSRALLEPDGACAPDEAFATLVDLLPLLDALGGATKHPGLLQPHAIDSIGHYLDATAPEAARRRLVAADASLRVCRRRPSYAVLTVAESEHLPHEQRQLCVPLLGGQEMARRMGPDERGVAEVVVRFGPTAQLLLREQRKRGAMLVLCTSAQKKRKVLAATLTDEAHVATLDALFATIGVAACAPHAAPSATGVCAVHTTFKNVEFWTLPRWYAQILARVAQDAFRLHTLFSASSSTVARPLLVDRVVATRTKPSAGKPSRLRLAVKFHGGSGRCVCAAHGLAPSVPFTQLELRFEFCGCATTRVRGRRVGSCPLHPSAEEEDATESTVFPGICAQAIEATLLCKHGVPGAPMDPSALSLPFAHLLVDGALRTQWLHAPLVDLLTCGAKLLASEALDVGVARELRERAHECVQDFYTLCAQHMPRADELQRRDEAAVALLREGDVVLSISGLFSRAGRTGTSRALEKLCTIVPTHGHLFCMASPNGTGRGRGRGRGRIRRRGRGVFKNNL